MPRSSPLKAKRGRPVDPTLPARRRDEILTAATHFFAKHGYLKADIELLAKDIGVGKGTIYRYFKNKEQLFHQALMRGLDELHRYKDLDAQPDEDGISMLRRGISAYFSYFDEHPEIIELIVLERVELKGHGKPTYFVHREQYLDPWRKRVQRLMASGEIRRMNVDTVISTIGMLMYGALVTHPYLGSRGALAANAAGVMDVILNGLHPSPSEPAQKP